MDNRKRIRDLTHRLLVKLKIDDKPGRYADTLAGSINRFYKMSSMKAVEIQKRAKRLATSQAEFLITMSEAQRESTVAKDFLGLVVEIARDPQIRDAVTEGMVPTKPNKPVASRTSPMNLSRTWGPKTASKLFSASLSPTGIPGSRGIGRKMHGNFKDILSPSSASQLAGIHLPNLSNLVKRNPEDENLVELTYGAKLMIKSSGVNPGYLKVDQKGALGIETYGTQAFIITHENQMGDLGIVRFQDIVCLCSTNGRYLSAEDNNQVSAWKKTVDSRTKWTIIPAFSSTSNEAVEKKLFSPKNIGEEGRLDQVDCIGDVKIYDTVAFRSSMGSYLTCLPSGMVALGPQAKSTKKWTISRAALPFTSAWTRRRPFQLWQPSLDPPPPMPNLPSTAKEHMLVNDLLFALMGVEGKWIKVEKVVKPGRGRGGRGGGKVGGAAREEWEFKIRGEISDTSMRYIVERMLPLCSFYYNIHLFVTLHSRYEFGLVNHALSACIREMLTNYLTLITQLEYQTQNGQLTLQRLWYAIQPSLHALKHIYNAVKKVYGCTGGAVLSGLYDGVTREGDAMTKKIYIHLLERASVPYLRMLELWIYEGIIQDPHDEFQIQSNDDLTTENLNKDFNDTYWEMRYTIRPDKIPSFLAEKGLSDKILVCGKYLNIIRECGHPADNAHRTPLRYFQDIEEYRVAVKRAYAYASRSVLHLLLKKQKLVERLRSIKRYFLLDQGDFFVHFMDIAKGELGKSVPKIVKRKLESLLELAVRTSGANNDPYKDDLSCFLQKYTLMQKLDAIHSTSEVSDQSRSPLSQQPSARAPPPSPMLRGLDAFTLIYRVKWPMSLIISMKSLTKYQLIFRHLFYCKHVEAELCKAWLHQQLFKELNVAGTFKGAYLLRQRMLHFLQNLVYYMMVEVLEPNWHTMVSRLREAKSVDDVLRVHNSFLDTCLTQCLLNSQHLFKTLTKLMTTCLDFTEHVKRGADCVRANMEVDVKKKYQFNRVQKVQRETKRAEETAERERFGEKVGMYNKRFDSTVGEFIEILRRKSNSQCDHHLANLSTRLDYNGFYTRAFPEVLDDNYAAIPVRVDSGI
ncbi:hypothetical protein AAMO2058_001067600 [Amorphochlora amoebiformis]